MPIYHPHLFIHLSVNSKLLLILPPHTTSSTTYWYKSVKPLLCLIYLSSSRVFYFLKLTKFSFPTYQLSTNQVKNESRKKSQANCFNIMQEARGSTPHVSIFFIRQENKRPLIYIYNFFFRFLDVNIFKGNKKGKWWWNCIYCIGRCLLLFIFWGSKQFKRRSFEENLSSKNHNATFLCKK